MENVVIKKSTESTEVRGLAGLATPTELTVAAQTAPVASRAPASPVDLTDFCNFYKGKKVLLTGHTGFKGSWLSTILVSLGAEVIGYSSCSKKETRLFDLCGIQNQITHVKGNVQDFQTLLNTFQEYQPEIVFHLAAQPIVRESYQNPIETYATNIMGTVNVLEAVRQTHSVRSVLNVTTDKVYENREWCWGYRENERLDGYDPYSNSKSCSELVTHSYIRSFFTTNSWTDCDKHSDSKELYRNVAVSTARAGNVIGGGDFAKDRIIPDCMRAAIKHSGNSEIIVRNPHSIRPYQHVLEPLFAYLLIAMKQYEEPEKYAGSYNVGPDEVDCIPTWKLVNLFCKHWGEGLRWFNKSYENGQHEANFLKLDCSKMKAMFGWKPRWDIETAVKKTVEWGKTWQAGGDVRDCMNEQIKEYLGK